MGQFDSETDAILTQLNYDELSKVPGGEFVEVIGDLLMLIGTGGLWAVTGGVSSLILKVRKLAGASYASNLIYTITAVRNDLKTLYESHEELRGRIESLRTDPKFAEAISAIALHAMHTSVKDRLKRLARIVVNSVKENDLEPEGLDDMMRAAMELTDFDVLMLGDMYALAMKSKCAKSSQSKDQVKPDIFGLWQDYWHTFPTKYPDKLRTSVVGGFGRLSALGLIYGVEATSMGVSPVSMNYWITDEGIKFYERLQEIAVPE
jgi:hypothetical protein